jgi:hypothetical protein
MQSGSSSNLFQVLAVVAFTLYLGLQDNWQNP